MANTYNEYTADGSEDTYAFTFPVMSTAHVEVFLKAVDGDELSEILTFTVVDATVVLDDIPAIGTTVRVSRNSAREATSAATQFATGRLRSEDLNAAIRQCFYLAQEAYEQASTGALSQITVLDNSLDEVLDRLGVLESLLGVTEPFFTYTVSTDAPAAEDGNNGEFWFEREE